MSLNSKIDNFLSNIKTEVVNQQKAVCHTVMNQVFMNSPHYNAATKIDQEDKEVYNQILLDYHKELSSIDSLPTGLSQSIQSFHEAMSNNTIFSNFSKSIVRGKYALGEYDANHKVKSNNQQQGNWNPPTRSLSSSYQLHSIESDKINNVNEIGDTITIDNIVSHVNSVETGRGWKKQSGYRPYGRAEAVIRARYGNILDEH